MSERGLPMKPGMRSMPSPTRRELARNVLLSGFAMVGGGLAGTVRVALVREDRWRLDRIADVNDAVYGGAEPGSGAAMAEVHHSAEWDAFAYRVDCACLAGYHGGLAEERRVERLAKVRGWTAHEAEAAIRYSWANVLLAEYDQIRALGLPPSRKQRFVKWRASVLRRSRLYRRVGDAWATGKGLAIQRQNDWLHMAKLKADEIAGPLPFEVCGTKPPD